MPDRGGPDGPPGADERSVTMTGSALAFPTPASLGSLDHYIQAVNRFPLLTAEQEVDLARRWRNGEDVEAARAARAVAPAARRRGLAQLHGLRAAAGRPDPGRQRRPDEGRAPLRPRAGRAARVVRAPLDQGRDPRVHPAQLAAGQGRDDQGAAQAVLQPAQHEDVVARADARAGARDRQRAQRQARGSGRDGDAPVRRATSRSTRRRPTTTSVATRRSPG